MYVYSLVGFVCLTYASSAKRIEFLQQCFKESDYYKIRMLENGLLALPFVGFLIYKNEVLLPIGLLLSAFMLPLIPLRTNFNFTLPTPFGKFPFEFTRGFRRFFLFHLLAYFVTYFAIASNNFNLAIFILLAAFLLNAIYFSYAEPLYYVWIYNFNPKLFLRHKLRTVFIYSLVLVAPIAVLLFVFFPFEFWITLIALLVGIAYVVLFMLMKYANYPHEASITEGFVGAACVVFPPLILISAPFYYYRSHKTISNILHD